MSPRKEETKREVNEIHTYPSMLTVMVYFGCIELPIIIKIGLKLIFIFCNQLSDAWVHSSSCFGSDN